MRKVFSQCLMMMAALGLGAVKPAFASNECGMTTADWNVPNGGVVFNRGDGPIRTVVDAIGEYRTHSMLSHGPGVGMTHATMATPGQNSWPRVCGQPIQAEQLQYGYPGVEQINQGATYEFLYGDSSGTEWIGYQLGNPSKAAAIADTLAYNHPAVSDPSTADSSQDIIRPLRNDERMNYSLFQYRDLETSNQIPSNSMNNGMVCSTLLSYAHNYAGQGVVTPYTYSHEQIANASTQLYASTNDVCHRSLGWFQSALLTVVCPTTNVCGNAASQVVNCMSTNQCDSSDSRIWRRVSQDPGAVATSISPDRVGGWGVHPWNATVWAPDYTHQVQWNSGGNVYGCWE